MVGVEQAIDPAFLSRLDMTFEIDLPDLGTTVRILADALGEVGTEMSEAEQAAAAAALEGVSGRDVRKLVLEAIVSRDASAGVDAPIRQADLWDAIKTRLGVEHELGIE